MPEKLPTKYQQEMARPEQKEFSCGVLHSSIEEALVHAEYLLGIRSPSGMIVATLEPYLGTMTFGAGVVVGWQTGKGDSYKRFRIDYDPRFAEPATKVSGINKGTKGVHVNQEGLTGSGRWEKICHATESSLQMADLYWGKWSKQYGRRGEIRPEDLKR